MRVTKRKWRPVAVLIAFTLGLLGMTACSSPSSQSGENKIVRINGAEPARGLIPAAANDTNGIRILDQIFAGLVTFKPNGEVVMDVAESITPSEDKKEWTVKLNQDRKFSDGTPVKAQNFVKAWKVSAAQKDLFSTTAFSAIEGADKDGKGNLTGLETRNDFEFVIKLKRPIADFPTRLGVNCFYPLPDSAFNGDKEIKSEVREHPIGNGPYKLESWDHDRLIKLRKSSSYRGPRVAENDGLDVQMYAKTDAAYNDLLAGKLDILDRVPDVALVKYKTDLEGRSLSAVSAGMQTIDIGYDVPHFSGEEGRLRRQAISLAINRPEIIETIFHGTRTLATDFLPPNISGHTDKLGEGKIIGYDPDEAKRLWQKANEISPWDGKFTITYNSDDNHQAWVDAVSNGLKNVLGIKAVGDPVPDFKTILSKIDNHSMAGAFRMGWTMGYPSAANLIEGRYMTGGSGNIVKYHNVNFDSMVEEAQAASSEEAAALAYGKAEEILAKDLPSIPLWTPNNNIGYSQNLDKVTTDWKGDVAYEKIIVR